MNTSKVINRKVKRHNGAAVGQNDFGNVLQLANNLADTQLRRVLMQNEPTSTSLLTPEQVTHARSLIQKLTTGLESAIYGQSRLLELTTICILSRGHLLLEGLPGLGKTELVKALSSLLGLSFRRVQFTPDLLPSDILGAPILEETSEGRRLRFHQGPIFANLLLADEINRATPKTQSALLEAMQERRVTVMGETHVLPAPFFVLATQNPIELEGTYPLPEAQLDRFMFKVNVNNVSSETLELIINHRQQGKTPQLSQALSLDELNELFGLVDQVHLPKAVANYIARLVNATNPDVAGSPEFVSKFVRFGSSPRAAIALASSSRASALVQGKPNVGFDDVRRVAESVLSHRLILDYSARMEGWTTPKVVEALLKEVSSVAKEIPADIAG